ncbi:MAG: hypothetical protein JW910_09275 [Anaerolineae bacterium]|nr:hypothetical protein [Anaerolineae bacterium]
MSRHTLLDLLGTERLPAEAERRFIDYCIWQQAQPALAEVLQMTELAELASEVTAADTLVALLACTRAAAESALRAGLSVLELGTVQGMATEVEQMIAAAGAEEGDAEAVSFHAARLTGWAAWARNSFSTGMFKSSAEEVAYGEQLQALMALLGVL